MSARYSHTTGVIRTYVRGKCYELKDDYSAVVSVIWTSDDKVELFAAHGEYGKTSLKDMFRELIRMGAKTAVMSRAKGHKMPWGVLVREEEFEDWYSVDLLAVVG